MNDKSSNLRAENIDWKAAYIAAVELNHLLITDANRYRFLRDHTYVEAYWIDPTGGVDTKIRVQGSVEHLDLVVDMERIKEAKRELLPEVETETGK